MHVLDRRKFLKAGGAALGVSAASTELLADDPADIVRVGFIGVGNRGTALLRNVLQIKGVVVRAICDIKPEHAERARTLVRGAGQKNPEAVVPWQKLLDMKDVDAVISALPCDLHAANYVETITSGKHLYGEKPMCLTPADCDAVIAAAGKTRKIVQIGFQRRADPRFIETIKQVHQGEIGDLVEARILWSNAWGPLYDWFGMRKRSGDWMVEQAVHNWDVLNWANRGVPVMAMGLGRDNLYRDKQPERDVHDYYSAVVEYENGVIVNILHSWVAPGQQGAFNPKFNEEYTRLIGVKGGVDLNTGKFSYRKELNKPDRDGHNFKGDINNTLLGLQAFVHSIRTGLPPVANVYHGRDAVLACLLVREAVYRKKVVSMKEILA